MKTPLQGQFNFSPKDLGALVKNHLPEDGSPHCMLFRLSDPVRQIGREFFFVVLALKLRPDLVVEQCGQGVLCQTEAEAKESVELLSQRNREPIVLAEGAGFGVVCKVKGLRRVITEQSVLNGPGPDGQTQWWWAVEREIDKATGEVTVLRNQHAPDEAQAISIASQWLKEYENKRQKYFDAIKESSPPPLPPRCKPLSPSELKSDLPAAKWTALKRQWPRTFEIFERRKADSNANASKQECQDAYLLDLVEQGYDPKAETIRGDLKLAEALIKAARSFARGKRKTTDLAIYLIAFNWELGWCYLSDAGIAEKLAEVLETTFTPEQIKKYRYRTLGLVAKHLSGPSPKSP